MLRSRASAVAVALVVVSTLIAAARPVRAVSVEEIPSPRPAGWAVDLTGTLPASALAEIDRLGDAVKAQHGGEMAVVVVDTTDGVPSRDFAVRLFNHWGIGRAGADDGVLLFAALSDRRVEIVLGDGLDDPERQQVSEGIVQTVLVPRFRAGDPAGAVLAGARLCASRFFVARASQEPVPSFPPRASAPLPREAPPSSVPNRFAPPPPAPEPARPESYVPRTRPRRNRTAEVLGLGMFLLAGGGIGWLALKPPRCSQCREPMVRVREEEDDQYLTPGENTEERIGSVSHTVWMCLLCGRTRKRSLGVLFSGYGHCPACATRALGSSARIVKHPTYAEAGRKRVDFHCAHCQHRDQQFVAISRLVPPDDDDDDSWTSSSRSGSSSGSSGSSGSGSSGFGGGRSSGGGSGGGW